MIHIKETEIIPLLKEAQTEYSQKIAMILSEEDTDEQQ